MISANLIEGWGVGGIPGKRHTAELLIVLPGLGLATTKTEKMGGDKNSRVFQATIIKMKRKEIGKILVGGDFRSCHNFNSHEIGGETKAGPQRKNRGKFRGGLGRARFSRLDMKRNGGRNGPRKAKPGKKRA